MTQTAAVDSPEGTTLISVPDAYAEVLPGVVWGEMASCPTPAYWAYQVAASAGGRPASHKLGQTLAEELAACLLGGHGIPASIGIAAFQNVRAARLLGGRATEQQLATCLREPLMVRGRSVRYRFAAQKAKYLAGSLAILAAGAPTVSTGRSLRDWLLQLPGVGFKTASWVARNWLDADDVAILDVHILRVGYAIGLFSPRLTVTRDYLKLEERFLALAQAMRVRPSQLDAVIWHEMASSPRTVQAMTSQHHSALPQPDHRQTNSPQAVLAV